MVNRVFLNKGEGYEHILIIFKALAAKLGNNRGQEKNITVFCDKNTQSFA